MATTRFAPDNQEIRQRFKTQFADANPTIRVIYENQPEDSGGTDPFPEIDEEFVKLSIRQNDSNQVAMGNPRCFRNLGTINAFIQTEAGKGTKRNEDIADLVGQAFANTSVGGIVYRSPRYSQTGMIRSTWFRGIVTIPYESTFHE